MWKTVNRPKHNTKMCHQTVVKLKKKKTSMKIEFKLPPTKGS